MAEMVIAVGRADGNTLTDLYTGYSFADGKAALAAAAPHIGWSFRGDPNGSAFVTIRRPVDQPPLDQPASPGS